MRRPLARAGSRDRRVALDLTAAFLAVYQFEKAFVLMASSCRPSGVRVSSAKTLNRYVPSPVIETMLLVLPTSAAKIASVRRGSSWFGATQPRSPPLPAVSASELSRASAAKSAPPSAWVLSLAIQVASGAWYMTWMTCQPKADFTGASSWPGWRPGARIAALKSSACDEVRSARSSRACRPCRCRPWRSSSSLLVRAIESNRDGSAWSFSYAASARPWRPPTPGPWRGGRRAPVGSSFGENRMWRTLTASPGGVGEVSAM